MSSKQNGTTQRILNKIRAIPISLLGLLKKDYTLLFRKKKYLYLSILLPLIIGLIYVFTLTDVGGNLKLGVCDFDDTSLTRGAIDSLTEFEVTILNDSICPEELSIAVKNRKYLFGIVIDKGFTEQVGNLKSSNLTVLYDNSDPSIAAMAPWKIDAALIPFKNQLLYNFGKEIKKKSESAKEKTQIAIELVDMTNLGDGRSQLSKSVRNADTDLTRLAEIDPHYVSNPVITNLRGVHEKYSLLEVGIAPLYAVLSLFIILMLCSTGVMYDRKMKLFERIRASNSPMTSYIISKILFFFTLAVVQYVIILLVFLAFGARYSIGGILLLKAIIFITLVNTLIGVLIGLISDSEGVAVLISLIITLPLLFLAGMFYPLELMPSAIQWTAKILPMHSEVLMMKDAMLFGGAISNHYFWIPLGLFVACMYFLKKKQ